MTVSSAGVFWPISSSRFCGGRSSGKSRLVWETPSRLPGNLSTQHWTPHADAWAPRVPRPRKLPHLQRLELGCGVPFGQVPQALRELAIKLC